MNCSFASQPRPLTGGAYAKNLPLDPSRFCHSV